MKHAALLVIMAIVVFAEKKPKETPALYPTSAVIPASCDAAWAGAVPKLAARGFAPTQSDRAGGIMWLRFVKGPSAGSDADKDAHGLTTEPRGWNHRFNGFRVASAVLSVSQEGDGCRVMLQFEYHGWQADGWRMLQSNGYLESVILADLGR